MPDLLSFLPKPPEGSLAIELSAPYVMAALGLAYLGAGVILTINLQRNGFLRGNFLGLSAAIIFFTTALAFLASAPAHTASTLLFWARSGAAILAFAAILGFIFLSLKSRFVIGGYQALAAAKQQLRQQERWMQLMQDNMTDGLAIYSAEGRLLYINRAALRLLGVKSEEAYQNGNIFFRQNGHASLAPYDIKRCLTKGEIVETRLIRQNNAAEETVIDAKFAPVYGNFRQVIGVTATYRDVTNIDKLEKAKEEFIQIASHELRTPLTATRGFLSLLQMNKYGKLSDKQKNLIEKALLATGRLSKLIDNILMVARIEESRVVLSPEYIKTEEVIESVLTEMAGEADRCNILLRYLRGATPLPELFADREKVYHIISNLVSNGIKYTPEGGHVFVETAVKGNNLQIKISDTGIGISKADLEKLFHKFERIKSQRSVKVGGSGLGLVIVKSFAELHNGHVDVESREGRGTVFTVSLPIASVDRAINVSRPAVRLA